MLALALTACGGSDKKSDPTTAPTDETEATDGETETTEDETETTEDDTETTVDEGELSPLAKEFAESFSSSSGIELPNDEIECLTDGIMDEFSVSELIALGEDVTATPDRDTMTRVGLIMDDCVSSESLAALFESQGIPAEAAACVADALAGEYHLSDIMLAGLYPDDADSQAVVEAVGTIAADCMA
jgi:hypothetical protein